MGAACLGTPHCCFKVIIHPIKVIKWWDYNSQHAAGRFFSPTTARLRVDHVLCDCHRTAVGRKCRKTCHTVTHTQPCRQLDPDQQQQRQRQRQTCKDGLENYVPRLSSSTCSREFSMHCWRVSSGPWRRHRPNCPSEPTIWRESVKPDSGRGESSGNLDKRTKLPPVTGWGMVKVTLIINAVRTAVNNAKPMSIAF